MSNLPDNVSYGDKDAPWNEPKLTVWESFRKGHCDRCDGLVFLDEENICEECFQPKPIEED